MFLEGGVFLFDCGEGTSRQMAHSQVSPTDLRAVFITHLHGDHIYGLPALGMILQGYSQLRIPLIAPLGLHNLDNRVYSLRGFKLKSILKPNESLCIEDSIPFDSERKCYQVYEDENFVVEAGILRHSVFCVGYVVREKGGRMRFNAEKVAALNIPSGPHFRDLQAGQDITLPDGRVISPNQVLESPLPARKVAILGDTCDSRGMMSIAKGADVLVHESTCLDEERDVALRHMHSTAGMAGTFARHISARHLILTHFSPRNFNKDNHGEHFNEARSIDKMIQQARRTFENDCVYPAADFWKFVVPIPLMANTRDVTVEHDQWIQPDQLTLKHRINE